MMSVEEQEDTALSKAGEGSEAVDEGKEAQEEQEDKKEKKEGKPPLVTFCERVKNLDDVWHTFDDAHTTTVGHVLLPLPLLPWLLDWYGVWGSLAFGLGLSIVWIAVIGIGNIFPKALKASLPALLSLAMVPLVAFGWWSSQRYTPFFAGPLYSAAIALVFLGVVASNSRGKKEDKAMLHLAPQLVKECHELAVEALHTTVYALTEQAVADRLAGLDALRDSLDGDTGVNDYAILADFDTALADLMNRAKPVSDLVHRAEISGDTETQAQADIAFTGFEKLAKRMHDLAVGLLGYAASPDPGVLDDLRGHAQDLSALRDAHRELELL